MLENTLIKFLAELHHVLQEQPNSYTASIINGALPYLPLYPNQTEHLFLEFKHVFLADSEMQGNDRIIEHFIENFPYNLALFGNEGDEKFYATRFINNFRDNYLKPQLYLISEEQLESLETEELTALEANQSIDPTTGEFNTEILAVNREGATFRLLYSEQGQILNRQQVNGFDSSTELSSQTQTFSDRSESSFQIPNETETIIIPEEFDTHIQEQVELITEDRPELLYTPETETLEPESTEPEIQDEAEAESIERNRREYQRAEASRMERLALESREQEQARAKQRSSQTARRMAIAAGAGATIFSGGMASIIIGGDLIGLFT